MFRCLCNISKDFTINNLQKTGLKGTVKVFFSTALTTLENKIPDHIKYITTPEFNKLSAENFAARIAPANLVSKSDIANFIKETDFDDKLNNLNNKITSNKTKHVLVENESNGLSKKVEAISRKGLTEDLINGYKILIGMKYFSSGIFQNYLVFIAARKYIKYFNCTTQIYLRKSNGMPEESIENITIKQPCCSNFC